MLRMFLATLFLISTVVAMSQNTDFTVDSSFMIRKKDNTTTTKKTVAPVEESPKKFDANKLVFGGNIGASFGDFTFVNISPQAGYMFKPWLTAGGGINFIYNGIKYRNFNGDEIYRQNYSYAGLNVFARVFPIRFIMLSAQPELNYSWGKTKFSNNTQPEIKLEGAFVPSLLLGAAVVIPSGGRGGMFIGIQKDVIQNERSPYGTQPYINIGFIF